MSLKNKLSDIKVKKYLLYLCILLALIIIFIICVFRGTTYRYDNEAVLGIEIKKTVFYEDKIVIKFAFGSLLEVEDVECYGADFKLIEEEPEFYFWGNTLTIKIQNADQVSEICVVENDNLHFNVRYLNSDSYAMLVYAWCTDVGYSTTGDRDSFFTQEEKDEQEARAIALAEAEEAAFQKLYGVWENESKTIRVEFSYAEDGLHKKITIYLPVADKWVEKVGEESILISSVDEGTFNGANMITLYDNPSWGCAYKFYLYNEDTEMECSYSDERFVKVE